MLNERHFRVRSLAQNVDAEKKQYKKANQKQQRHQDPTMISNLGSPFRCCQYRLDEPQIFGKVFVDTTDPTHLVSIECTVIIITSKDVVKIISASIASSVRISCSGVYAN
jgi:hypothetical protein